jgi:hypothetical protein
VLRPRLPKAKQPSLLTRKPIPKPKLLRSNPLRKSLLLEGNEWGFLIDDEAYLVETRYRKQINLVDKNGDVDDLSDEIKWKLFLARQLALVKYREKWAT